MSTRFRSSNRANSDFQHVKLRVFPWLDRSRLVIAMVVRFFVACFACEIPNNWDWWFWAAAYRKSLLTLSTLRSHSNPHCINGSFQSWTVLIPTVNVRPYRTLAVQMHNPASLLKAIRQCAWSCSVSKNPERFSLTIRSMRMLESLDSGDQQNYPKQRSCHSRVTIVNRNAPMLE